MRVEYILSINGAPVECRKPVVRLDIQTPGRAIMTVLSDTAPERGNIIELIGKNSATDWVPQFLGYIETVQKNNTRAWQITAREITATLNRRLVINQRHCLPRDVLASISEQTGLTFVLPNNDWTQQQLPRFQHIGGGYGALDNILRVWGVNAGIWQLQTDGRVYIGELSSSVYKGAALSLPASIFKSLTALGGTIPLQPRIRPGIAIQIDGGDRQIIHQIDIDGDFQRLQWRPTINAKALRAIP